MRIRNLPAFAHELDRSIEVTGVGELRVDTAFGGDSFVIVDAEQLGLDLVPHNARRLAVLHARENIRPGEPLVAASIIDSRFKGRIDDLTEVAGRPAIVPSIESSAYLTGRHELWLDAEDPWPEGYRLSDTWPGA